MKGEHPNIVVLFSDQLRPFELGCYGGYLNTPNIDALAASGVRFETACTSNPLCTPARSSFLSGQYSRTCTGMLGCCGDPSDTRCKFPDTILPERLQLAGYETCLTGKWHIEPHPQRVGFNQTIYPKVAHLNVDQLYYDGSGNKWIQRGYCPDFEVETSKRFIRRKREKPFFLFHSLSLPHMPYFDIPERFREMYSSDDVQLRPNVWKDGKLWHDEHALLTYWYDYLYYREKRPDMQVLPEGFDIRKLHACYFGMIASVDEQIGRIMDCLRESGQLENTIVLLTADHGDNLGSHHLWNKISVNDESIRIPLIISWPGQIAPKTVDTQVASLVDLAPTLLSLSGCEVPAHMQGRDLTPIVRGEQKTVGDASAYIENFRGELTVRTPSHMFSVMTQARHGTPQRHVTDDDYMFYDLREAPFEMDNLSRTGTQQTIANELRERVLQWDATTPWMPGSLGGPYAQGPGN